MKTLMIPIALTALALSACEPMISAQTADTIPEAVQGRWGITANDCDPARDDNKGLMVVEPTQLTFYESRGTLGEITDADSTRIEARFDFAGEGQTWQRDMVLDVQDGGNTLIRRDYGDDAMPGPLRYMNCATL